MSNNIVKQSGPSKMVAKHRSDKSKIAVKSSSTNAKTDATLAAMTAATAPASTIKRKIAKENGAPPHSIDEKKGDKTRAAAVTLNSKQKIPTDQTKQRKSEVKPVIDGKTTKSMAKKVIAGEKDAQKRSSDKVKSIPSKESRSKHVSKEIKKPSKNAKEPPPTKDSNSSKSSKVAKPSAEPPIKTEIVSNLPKPPLKATSHTVGAKKTIAEASTSAAAAAAATISSKNVMMQVHNVTVQSPPPVRRESVSIDAEKPIVPRFEQPPEQRRGRTRTRTLEAAEIVLLKPNGTAAEAFITSRPTLPMPVANPILAPALTATTQIEPAPILNASVDAALVEIKPAVAFDVMLSNGDDIKPKKPIQNEKPKQISDGIVNRPQPIEPIERSNEIDANANESDNYEDDFESYESDFETDISNGDGDGDGDEDDAAVSSDGDGQTQDDLSISTAHSDTDDENVVSTASKHPFETGHSIENSEFDSGSFEMKVLSARSRVQHKTERNKLATPTVTVATAVATENQQEMQNDSGIENTVGGALMVAQNGQMNSFDANNKTFDNISDIEVEGAAISLDAVNGTNPISNSNPAKTVPATNKTNETKSKPKTRLERRGEELLSKITLDVMNYVLFDFKPIPYELFMKIYGNSNTAQVAVQTHNDRIDQDCQCDATAMRTVWSQHPIAYYTEHINRSDFDDYKNGYGTVAPTAATDLSLDTQNTGNSQCENSLGLIRQMATQTNATTEKAHDDNEHFGKLNIDYGHLHRFLLESEMTLARILNTRSVRKRVRNLNESSLPISNGYFTLKPSFIDNFAAAGDAPTKQKIERTFAIDSLPGFLFTLHFDCDSKLNVLALWHLSKLNEPVCLLSVWSNILCVEIHPKIRDIVFAGLDDGSIAVWDYSESKYWHPNLGDKVKRFVPSQITTPTFDQHTDLNDFGRCVAIRGLPIATDTELLNGYNPKQMCSLHECGLLILWTLLSNTANTYTDLPHKRIEHQSLWSKVKLIQNKVIDLSASVRQMFQLKRAMRRPTSKSFDKTRSYFESELFNDAALQELHRMHADDGKLLTTFRCTAIELTSVGILISTNENFLLLGRKSFKNESFRRIQIDACKSVRVECMVSLFGFDDDIVVIVLNNGAVKSLCCDLSDEIDELQANSDIDDGPWSLSPATASASAAAAAAAADAKASTAYALPVDSIIFAVAPASNGPVATMSAMAAPYHGGAGYSPDGNSFGKSCTIQSLVINERKIYDDHQTLNHSDNLEFNRNASTIETVPITSAMQTSMRCTQLLNGQTLFNNSMDLFAMPTITHQHLVQLVKSHKLIILRKNRLRIYDLIANQMIEMPSNRQNQKYMDATTTTADHNEEYLVLLNSEGIVELHQIKI